VSGCLDSSKWIVGDPGILKAVARGEARRLEGKGQGEDGQGENGQGEGGQAMTR
jgi:hypothetical protein